MAVDYLKNMEKVGGGFKPSVGKIVCAAPFGQDEEFNFTLHKGRGSDLWYSFLSHLDKKGYQITKVGENLEVSPVDAGYYNLTQKQKDEMEMKIKQGLASVAQSVSDFELIAHDVRKYKEFLKMIREDDEHSLRAIFIDEVDISTGNNSIKGIVIRWPTLISDFMTLGEKLPIEVDVNKIKDELKISKAEAVLLSTKQRLYNNWKKIFGSEVEGRLSRLLIQKNSRERTITEYKNWLKPLVARHRLHKEGLSDPGSAKKKLTDTWHSPAQAISTSETEIWAWQPIVPIEPRKGTMQMRSEDGGFGIDPYDKFISDNFIFDEKKGLKSEYHWIDEKWVKKVVEEIKGSEWMKGNSPYYVLLNVKYSNCIIKLPTGDEMDDVTFKTKNWFLSQNALLVLLLKIRAQEDDFDREINQLIGISGDNQVNVETIESIVESWKEDIKEDKKGSIDSIKENIAKVQEQVSKIIKFFGLEFALSRHGPYEHNFGDRITNMYLVSTAVDYYIPHLKLYLLGAVGVGK
ncbi:MAG: hypothetical protein DRP06_02165 [Candidatus Aenigmatarchaeota archaeon]|nr:MAG: hypothetical protein DRP06_02165 [Candidatus Aenigmarchaeota archaeon]